MFAKNGSGKNGSVVGDSLADAGAVPTIAFSSTRTSSTSVLALISYRLVLVDRRARMLEFFFGILRIDYTTYLVCGSSIPLRKWASNLRRQTTGSFLNSGRGY